MARAWVLFLLAATAAAETNPYARLLRNRGVEPTRHGIAQFLDQFVPTPDTPAQITALIDMLHGPDAELREQAVRRLGRIPFLSSAAVRDAFESGDPEVRRLCKRILDVHRRSNHHELLHAAFQTIRIERYHGLCRILIAALPHCGEMYLLLPAQLALAATARRADVPRLKNALESPFPSVRVGAAHALGSVLRKGAVPDLTPLFDDDNAHVRLAAAEVFAKLGMRECLQPLVGLLESSDARVRYRAAGVLRALTGKKLGYVSYAPADKRKASAQRWENFVRTEGATVPLRLPLRLHRELLGRTLVCSINNKRLEEYDRAGQLVFKSGNLAVPWGCQGLPNGHRLVAVFSANVVIEYDNSGKEVWRTGLLPGKPMSVQRLENGNTLIACSDSGKIVEVSPNKRVVWSITLPGRPIDARRLSNGRTLIALYQGRRIVEVGPGGAILWELKGPGTPSTVQRLGNGNTVVAGLERHGVVTEYNRTVRIIWRLDGLGTVYEAQRLPNGHTLVATARGVAVYDRARKIVWRKDLGACRAMRY